MECRQRRRAVRKSRELRRKMFFIMTITMILSLGTFALGGQGNQTTRTVYESVVIHSGDTIWSIAEEYKMEKENIEHMVDKIMKMNDLCSSNIKAGQRIIVPVEEGIS